MAESRYILLVLLALVALTLMACAPETHYMETTLAEGREIYISECSQCHQPDGEGFAQIYPNLAGNPIVTLHDPNPAIEVVLSGRGSMPGFRDELKVEELAKVITYIRTAWGNNASPVTPAQMK